MRVLWDELAHVGAWAALIEAAAGVLLTGYCTVAFCSLLRIGGIAKARVLVAEGAMMALSFIVCAALLKTLLLSSWQQIGIFGSIFCLRFGLKKVFAAESVA